MAIVFKTPEDVATEYLQHLKGLRPEINTDQEDTDWWIRSRVIGGLGSGLYADQRKIADDAFPQSARREALEKFLNLYFDSGFIAASQAVGTIRVTGTNGSAVPIGTQFTYDPNGNVYQASSSVIVALGIADVPVTSVATGSNQNLLQNAEVTLSSPPPGINPTGIVYGANISDGRDEESNEQASARILAQIRSPIAGGKVSDYQQFALAADPSVVAASVVRYPFGFGTVAVVITAGTTDIDGALDAGNPIILIPSVGLINTVSAYIETQKPVTDCVTVIGPTPISIDVTVKVKFATGTGATIISGQTLTQTQLVQREIQRAIYHTPPGGRIISGTGYVLASDMEQYLDINLSAVLPNVGLKAQILTDRQVQNLDGVNVNKAIASSELAIPGTITVIEL